MNISRVCALLLGGIIILFGIFGFFQFFTPGGYLFGIFSVNLVHNLIHLVTGLVGVIVAIPNQRRYASWYILEMGVIYGIVTIVGFLLNGDIFEFAYFNLNDNLLHAGITVIAFILTIFILLEKPEQYTGMALGDTSTSF
jgi:hypothetical protein